MRSSLELGMFLDEAASPSLGDEKIRSEIG